MIFLGFILLIYLWFVFLIFYHFVRFGIGVEPKRVAFFFLLGSFLFFLLLIFGYSFTDWQKIKSFFEHVFPIQNFYFLQK
jgi:hypothetical protein